MYWHRLLLSLMTVGIISQPVAADPLLDWLPSSVNGIAVVRVAEIHDSPLAKREGWAKTAAQNFVSQKALVPPGADVLVFGTEFGLSPDLPALKEYAVVSFERPMPLQTLSDLGFGDTETINGKTTLTLNQGGFLWQEADGTWRFTAPGGRQAGLKWMRQPATGSGNLSPFLKETVDASLVAAQVLLALELSDAFTPASLTSAITPLSSLSKLSPEGQDRVVATLAGVRGISLQVNVEEQVQAQLRVTFHESPYALMPVALPLLQDILGLVGASLESTANWQPSLSENTIVFRGPITPAEVRRVLSLFRGHDLATASASPGATPAPGESATDQMAAASQTYYREVSTVIDDLRSTLKDNRDNHALWFEKAGRKIDGLKMLNVDPDLLTFGQRVSSSFRYQGQALRTANVRGGVRIQNSGANNQYQYFNTYVGPYGGAYWTASRGTPANAGAITAQEQASAKGVQFSEWKQIEDGLVEVRRQMTERYRKDF